MLVKTVSKVLLAIGFLTATMLLTSPNATAQEPITQTLSIGMETSGLDVMFLIDNSGSMYAEIDERGEIISDIGNDEHMLRLESVRHVIKRLLFYNQRLQPGVKYRVGVITFGGLDTSTVDIALEPLKTGTDTGTDEARDRRYKYLANLLSEDQRGNTHPLEAFEMASDVWTDNPAPDGQVKAIILLTDGRPHIMRINDVPRYIGEGERKTVNEEFEDEYFKELKRTIQTYFPLADSPGDTEGYHVWVVAMNEDWYQIQSYWEEIIGQNWRRISNANQIPETFNDILDQIYPLSGRMLKPGNFAMWPYLDSAAFSLFATEPLAESDVTFYRQDGTQLVCSDSSVQCETIGDTIRWIEVYRPEPGVWTFQVRGYLTVQVRFDPLFGKMQMVYPAGIQTQLSTVNLAYQLYDIDGIPIEEQPGFPLMLEGKLFAPDAATPEPLQFDPMEEGKYISRQGVTLLTPGEYLVEIEGTAIDSLNEQVTVVPPQRHGFVVGLVSARVVPAADPVTPLTAADLELEIVGPDNKPVEIDAEGDVVVKATLYSPDRDAVDALDIDMRLRDKTRIAATNEIVGLRPGEYWIKAQGTFVDGDSRRIDLFDIDERAFTVSQVSAERVSGSDVQQPFQLVDLVYQVTDANGNRVDVDPDLDVRIQLHVEPSTGDPAILDMAPIGGGRFSAPVFFGQGPAQYTVMAKGCLEAEDGRLDLFQTTPEVLSVDTLQLDLVKPGPTECVPEHTSVRLEFELRTGAGDSFTVDPDYPLDFTGSFAEIVGGGSRQPITPSLETAGHWVAEMVPDKWGQWQAHIEGSLVDPEGNTLEAVSDDKGFCVMDVIPVSLRIVSPISGQVIPLRAGPKAWPLFPGRPTPVDLQVQFVNIEQNDRPIGLGDVTTGELADVLGTGLIGPSNDYLPEQLAFAVAPQDSTVVMARSDGLVEEGTYTFTVVVLPDAPAVKGLVYAANAQDTSVFTRRDVHRVLGIVLSAAQGIAGLAVLVIAGFLGLLYTDPMQGSLVFKTISFGQTVDTLRLPKKRWARITLPPKVQQQAGIKRLYVANQGGDVKVTWKGDKGPTVIKRGKEAKVGEIRAHYEAPAKAKPGTPAGGRWRPRGRR